MRKYLFLWVLCSCALLSYAQRPSTVTMATTFPSGNIAYKALGVHNQMDLGLSNSNASLEIQSKPLNVGNPSNQSSGQTVISSSVGLVNVKTLKGTGKAELGSSVTGTGVAQAAFGQLEASIDSSCNNEPRCEGTPGLGAKTLEVLGNSKVFLYGKNLMDGCPQGANWQKIGGYYYLVCGSINCTLTDDDCHKNGKQGHVNSNCECEYDDEPTVCDGLTCTAPKSYLNTTDCKCECPDAWNNGNFCENIAHGSYDEDNCTCSGCNMDEVRECIDGGGSWDERHCDCSYPCTSTSSYWKTQQLECESAGKTWDWNNCRCKTGGEHCYKNGRDLATPHNNGAYEERECEQWEENGGYGNKPRCCNYISEQAGLYAGQYFSTCTTENEGQWYKTLTQEWMTAGGCWEEDRIIECICE